MDPQRLTEPSSHRRRRERRAQQTCTRQRVRRDSFETQPRKVVKAQTIKRFDSADYFMQEELQQAAAKARKEAVVHLDECPRTLVHSFHPLKGAVG